MYLHYSPWSYPRIALCLNHEIVIFMVPVLQVCRAERVLRFAGSTDECFQVLGTGP